MTKLSSSARRRNSDVLFDCYVISRSKTPMMCFSGNITLLPMCRYIEVSLWRARKGRGPFSHRCEAFCGIYAALIHPPFSFRGKKTGGARPKERRLIGSLDFERLLCLRNGSACQGLYLNDLVCIYLRCRFACDSAALRNFRLLRIFAVLLLPAKAALLSSPQYLHHR